MALTQFCCGLAANPRQSFALGAGRVWRGRTWGSEGVCTIIHVRLPKVVVRVQDVAEQTMHLEKAGAIEVFRYPVGHVDGPAGTTRAPAYARKGDTLAVVRLDRLGRSLAVLTTPLGRHR